MPKLRQEADIVVALTHLGFYEESGGGYSSAGDLLLAREVGDIDVIVGGHSHTSVTEAEVVGKTLIVQAGGYSENVGRLDLVIDSDSDKITEYQYKLIPVNDKKRVKYKDKKYYVFRDRGYVEDQDILQAAEPFLAQASGLLTEPVGEALVELVGGKSAVRSQETNLGNLITDAMMVKTGAEIAFQNGGGIRSSLAPGIISYRDILTVQPFGNTLTLLELTGRQIMEVLNYAANVKPGNGAFLHVGGLKWTLNRKEEKGLAENVMVGNAALDMDKTYTVVTNNFMASGGDGYKMLQGLPSLDSGYVDADALKEHIQKLGKLKPTVEGRLTIVQ